MPLARYFLFVGAALLTLLFISNAYLPKLPVTDKTEAAADLPTIRIHSDRKWPERVVFDTSIAPVAPVQLAKTEPVVSPPATVADVSAKAHVRDSFAQLQPSDLNQPSDLKKPEVAPKPQRKRKIAKRRVAPPTVQVAQQPLFGFFANNTW
ncbi:MAG: hypothetical protein JWP25_1675 [Bradyrhizobium sp.]|jgi:hypothetical protein|nr:hypothetical protein [Bradyrhizobium sp.]MEA2865414.1 hypothetical protein [Bradyrhizobium sp.]